jgi:hypothetical protein
MFYYYGRKKQIAKYYPLPNYSVIVEPFAGSAAYSLHGENWKKEVILVEKDKRVAAIWEWLINEATPEQVNKLPDLKVGEKVPSFAYNSCSHKMAFHYKTIKVTPVLARNWEISKDIYKITFSKLSTGR